ncbi:clotting factor B-like [Ornithodoros turicata]|uniref:clotting factor B-like n=1 Tax=Ornithodoros turicata TaxID=34597 RepID=UPI00313A4AF3
MAALKWLFSCVLLANFSTCQESSCGTKRSKAQPGVEWPWTVAIMEYNFGKKYLCAGTLISNKHVMTAAHCFDGKSTNPRRYTVLVETTATTSGTEYKSQKIDFHPTYIRGTAYGDIAIITLRSEIPEVTTPICLPSPDDSFDFKPAFVAQWLPNTPDLSGPYQLRIQRVLISANDVCKTEYASQQLKELNRGISRTHMCTDLRGKQGDCHTLNGSPLMATDRSVRWIAVAVASFRPRCDDQTNPGIYTRVSLYLPWIQKIIRG